MTEKKNKKHDQDDLVWPAEGESADVAPDVKSEKPEASHEIQPSKKKVDDIREKIEKKAEAARAKLAEFQSELGDAYDVMIVICPGISGPRFYIIRSMTLRDIGETDKEYIEMCQDRLDEYKEEVDAGKRHPDAAILTPEEQEDLRDYVMLRRCVLYPEHFEESLESKNIRPGDVQKLMEAVISISGYVPPTYDTGMDDMAIPNNIQREADHREPSSTKSR